MSTHMDRLTSVDASFLAQEREALTCTSVGYNGCAALSMIGDSDTMPDLERLIEYALDELAWLRRTAQEATLAAAR